MKRLMDGDWWKRCVTRRVLVLFELGTMALIGAAVLVALR